MVCLKAHDKSSTRAEHSFLLIFSGSWTISEMILKNFLTFFLIKKICYYLIKTKTAILNTFLWESTKPRPYMYLYSAWISRRDLPLQGLSCCLVKHFNISGSEFVGSCIKSTGRKRCRAHMGARVGVATVGVGIAVACSVVGYVQVVSFTKGWSPTRTCVNSFTVTTWLDVHLNRSVAIDVI